MIHKLFILTLFYLLVAGCAEENKPSKPPENEPSLPPEDKPSTPLENQPSMPLESEPPMPKECTSLIPLGTRAANKNECSGPYVLNDVEFFMIGRALALKLEGKVDNLAGDSIDKHATVLFSKTGITPEDKAKAEQEYQKWQKSRSKKGPISFYLAFWTGKNSELILGELKELVEQIRAAFPSDKVPQPPRDAVHVKLAK